MQRSSDAQSSIMLSHTVSALLVSSFTFHFSFSQDLSRDTLSYIVRTTQNVSLNLSLYGLYIRAYVVYYRDPRVRIPKLLGIICSVSFREVNAFARISCFFIMLKLFLSSVFYCIQEPWIQLNCQPVCSNHSCP